MALAATFTTQVAAQTPAPPPVYLSHPTVVDTAHLKGADTPPAASVSPLVAVPGRR